MAHVRRRHSVMLLLRAMVACLALWACSAHTAPAMDANVIVFAEHGATRETVERGPTRVRTASHVAPPHVSALAHGYRELARVVRKPIDRTETLVLIPDRYLRYCALLC
jgi:hypothetical protein